MALVEDRKVVQDPSSRILRALNYADWLQQGDSISTSTWTLPPALTLVASSHTTTLALFTITGGVDGQNYEVTNRITTTKGDWDDKTILIKVRET